MVRSFAPNGHQSGFRTQKSQKFVDYRSTFSIIGSVTDSRTITWLDCTIAPKPQRKLVMSPMLQWPQALWSFNNGSETPAK